MNVVIDGIEYTPLTTRAGSRAVVVVDRGWIFAGDVEDKSERVYLTNAVWVFKWDSCGFAAVVADPSKADIRQIADLDFPAVSEIFRIPVADGWGVK